MALSRAEVEHVARLAHIGLHPGEIAELAAELSGVLEHVNRLREVDTTGIEPSAHVAHLSAVLRDDVARPSWPALTVLANAPRAVGDQFAVRGILD